MHRNDRPTRSPVRSVLCLAALLLLLATAARASATSLAQPGGVPLYLDILEAALIEIPPIDSTAVPSRQVEIGLRLAAPPPCFPAGPHLVYGLAVDSDRDASTGLLDPAFKPLGVDGRLTAVCDAATGTLVSPLGPVTLAVDPATGATLLQIHTAVSMLPSLDLDWIAFAQENILLSRLPDSPAAMRWATHEILTW